MTFDMPDLDVFLSGKELLERVSEKGCDYDLIFLDVLMPEVTGIESAERLRRFCSDVLHLFLFFSFHNFAGM